MGRPAATLALDDEELDALIFALGQTEGENDRQNEFLNTLWGKIGRSRESLEPELNRLADLNGHRLRSLF